MVMLGFLPNLVSFQDISVERTRKSYLQSTLILSYVMSIKNNPLRLHNYITAQDVDLSRVTKTWMKEGEAVTLKELTPPGFLLLHQPWTVGWVAIIIGNDFFFRALPIPQITGIDCVGLGWDSGKRLVGWLVYHPHSTPVDLIAFPLLLPSFRLPIHQST